MTPLMKLRLETAFCVSLRTLRFPLSAISYKACAIELPRPEQWVQRTYHHRTFPAGLNSVTARLYFDAAQSCDQPYRPKGHRIPRVATQLLNTRRELHNGSNTAHIVVHILLLLDHRPPPRCLAGFRSSPAGPVTVVGWSRCQFAVSGNARHAP